MYRAVSLNTRNIGTIPFDIPLVPATIGEILINSIDRDGTGFGFDFDLVKLISRYSNVPIIICSGAGSKEDVLNLVKNFNCDGVGIGSIFHYNYIKKVESKYMSYNSNKLRMGKEIDSGNIEFIKKNYSNLHNLEINPISIQKLKKYLNKSKIKTHL